MVTALNVHVKPSGHGPLDGPTGSLGGGPLVSDRPILGHARALPFMVYLELPKRNRLPLPSLMVVYSNK